MEKHFTEVAQEKYKGYEISLKAAYYSDHKEALKATRDTNVLYYDEQEYQAIVLALRVRDKKYNDSYKDEIVKATKENFIDLNTNYIAKKIELLAYAKDSIDTILYENEVTSNLEDTLREKAYKQSQQG